MKTTTDIIRTIGNGLTRDHLNLFVRKNFVRPLGRVNRRGQPFAYRDKDLQLMRLLWRFHLEGYTWDASRQKAQSELLNPDVSSQ